MQDLRSGDPVPVGIDGHPSPDESVWKGDEMTGIWVSAAFLFGLVIVILMSAMR